ncbi:hypothetical protein BJ912DRAFT_1148505 [Pholiota molesta]|nr:hypothetical protein BJ912DRAFT_1148505 [Pholiota molesta]
MFLLADLSASGASKVHSTDKVTENEYPQRTLSQILRRTPPRLVKNGRNAVKDETRDGAVQFGLRYGACADEEPHAKSRPWRDQVRMEEEMITQREQPSMSLWFSSAKAQQLVTEYRTLESSSYKRHVVENQIAYSQHDICSDIARSTDAYAY